MLKSLNIKDFALVDKLELEFEKGMISLTGETGAGKSILLGAIGIISGDKPKKNAVRNGSDKAIVSGVFDISYLNNVKQFLKEKDLLDEENENECIIRRVIRKDGRSSTFINESSTNLGTLKSLAEMLIEIHGQHQHQNLSKSKKQLDIIDSYSGLKELRKIVSELYREWKTKEKEAADIEQNFREKQDRFQLLSYKKNELEELGAFEGEYEELEIEEHHLSSADNVISTCEETVSMIDDDDYGAITILNKIIANIESLDQESDVKEILDMLESAKINVEESLPILNSYKDKFEVNPERLMDVKNRMKDLDRASETFHCLPENIHKALLEINEEIATLNYSEDAVDESKRLAEEAFNSYLEKATELSQKRKSLSVELSKEVNNETRKLNLAEDILRIDFINDFSSKEKIYNSYGLDDAKFLIRPNLGQDYQSISEIASGGELSRLSLAVQVVSFKNEKKPTMIFDEVDTGLSGETGNVVGELLRRVGNLGQVMCVTHLPQVASQGHSHFFVSKNDVERDGQMITLSNIKELKKDERVKEIARMIGGDINSTQSIENAKLMLSLQK